MENGWLLIVLLIWIVSAISKASNKQKKTQAGTRQTRPAAPGGAPRPSEASAPRQAAAAPHPAAGSHRSSPAPAQPLAQPRPDPAHAFAPLETHMHAPTAVMGTEGEGTEGIDCCHEYMLDRQEPEALQDVLPFADAEDEEEKARALLQGVIFSEVLGRRTARRYGGRRA